MIKFAVTLGLIALAPQPVFAQDLRDKLVSSLRSPSVWGAEAERRTDPAVQGGAALRISTTGNEKDPWEVGVYTLVDKPVRSGDRLILAFWARLERAADGAETATIPMAGIQHAAPPNRALFSDAFTLTHEWQMFQVSGEVTQDFAPGSIAAALQLASGRHTIDIGPIYVLDMGQ